MAGHGQRMDVGEEQEELALFHSYPNCAYYVQSPSTLSHANSTTTDFRFINNELSVFHSPPQSEHFIITNPSTLVSSTREASRFELSRYSSSRGSNHSFLHEKKISYDLQSHGGGSIENGDNALILVHGNGKGGDGEEEEGEEEEHEEEYYGFGGGKGEGWWRYFSFRTSSSSAWIALQISWRLMVSLGVALLVFYLATKPPPPKVSVKMARVGEFGLGEGVDGSGVATKILTCNCSLDLVIDNKSKIFGLHLQPPLISVSFSNLPFASSSGPELYAESHGSTLFRLYVGTRNEPVYGAGRAMQDMLDSANGLPLLVRVGLRSSFHVVWNLIRPKFHHRAQCSLVLHRAYDKKRRSQSFRSNCILT
ncbi:uncharacterized protein LOC131165042 [Malania oleifera]|uniref:uncharacterized protein LOC131165042 n=1 Tax=Malania oleifera TaxID=397392 RepID=UPI0025ADE273|nr:uncharacterized protein LOC131165042 [Malania oleifera]